MLSKTSAPLELETDISLMDLSSKDLCRSMFSFGLSRSLDKSKSSSSEMEQRESTFGNPGSLVPSIESPTTNQRSYRPDARYSAVLPVPIQANEDERGCTPEAESQRVNYTSLPQRGGCNRQFERQKTAWFAAERRKH